MSVAVPVRPSPSLVFGVEDRVIVLAEEPVKAVVHLSRGEALMELRLLCETAPAARWLVCADCGDDWHPVTDDNRCPHCGSRNTHSVNEFSLDEGFRAVQHRARRNVHVEVA
jgi:hypothetical protein